MAEEISDFGGPMAGEIVSPAPLKHARSQAELTRVRQGWVLIALAATNVVITSVVLLHSFGIIP